MPIPNTEVTVEGHALVSEDGMISDAAGIMPPRLRNEADWAFFQAALDRAALIVSGRLGHERHPNPGRRRLALTHRVAALEPDGNDPLATFWNPAGIGISEALQQLGIVTGKIAITGGTGTYDHFLPYYDVFVLSEIRGYVIPGGRPCFGGGHPRFVLSGAGYEARLVEVIDAAAGVTQTHWMRP
jgi:dihydrofolate reductase